MEKLQKYGAYSSFFLSWPRATEDGGRGIITVQEALRDIEQQIGKPKRGNPGKPGQFCAVCEARNFFDRHSPRRPSADEKNPFAEFCELFLRAVSGVAVKEGTLTWAIRGALKQGKEANRRKNAD